MFLKRTHLRIWVISIMNSLQFHVNMNSVYLQEPDDPKPKQRQPPKGTRSRVHQILCQAFQMWCYPFMEGFKERSLKHKSLGLVSIKLQEKKWWILISLIIFLSWETFLFLTYSFSVTPTRFQDTGGMNTARCCLQAGQLFYFQYLLAWWCSVVYWPFWPQ